ncbi:ATP-binding protein [Halococcus sp. PRR34]|uniref:ATP-binding protein n=1 Tax=Halococcus sp. PRR34 TaxID=3020830 RepID=UPI00236131EE|nr:ATP-binding protein [Halococcus sp. PRR34]
MPTASESPENNPGEHQDPYLDAIGWSTNPFNRPATADEYVLTNAESISDITAKIQNYNGPVLLHSPTAGVGKTTLLDILLESLSDEFVPLKINGQATTVHGLVATLADELAIEVDWNTQQTKQRLHDELGRRDAPVLLGVHDLDLATEEALYAVHELTDLSNIHIILSGTASSWETIGQVGSVGQTFQRDVSYQLRLDPLSRAEAYELYQRRVATATEYEHDEYQEVPFDPITETALDEVYDRSDGVPALIISAFEELIDRATDRYLRTNTTLIATGDAKKIDYSVSSC